MSNRLRIMLVDDHAVVRAGYRLLLGQTADLDVICEAERGEEACQRHVEHTPDVTVMDLSLPGIGGLAAIRRIRARDPAARILACSIHDEAVFVQRTLEAGALGYISKSCPPDILIEAVRRVGAGERFVEPSLAHGLDPAGPNGDSALTLEGLSAREFDVFCLLAQGRTTREVAEELHLGYKTAANYSSAIKAKLGISTAADMARLAMRHGILKG